jgi:hypothetical protein
MGAYQYHTGRNGSVPLTERLGRTAVMYVRPEVIIRAILMRIWVYGMLTRRLVKRN